MRAYAKINLGLRVLHKRKDGYHEIETILHRVNPYDELFFEPSGTISMECTSPDLPTDERNLCIRAAMLLRATMGIEDGVHIHLRKNIPAGSGLGGGSSDAAACLRGLPGFWRQPLPSSTLMQVAASLGSDVPFFMNDGTALATGRGEKLEYFGFDLPHWILLVHPKVHVSTSWAYGALNLPSTPPVVPPRESLKDILHDHAGDPASLRDLLANDFEPVVGAAHPDILRLKETLYAHGGTFAQMSGSGSAVYAFFPSEAAATDARNAMPPEYSAFITPPFFEPSAKG